MADSHPGQDHATLGQLFTSASHDLSALVHSEVELAKAEVRQDVRNAALGMGMFGAAVLFCGLGVVLGSVTAVHGLRALGLTLGWSYLVVTGACLLIAALLALVGVRSVRRVRPPERTIRTTRDNVALLRSGNSRTKPGG